MYCPNKRTHAYIYPVPINWVPLRFDRRPPTWVTCRPTYYFGLFYAGFSSLARIVAEPQRVAAGSRLDYVIYGGCLVAAFVMAQVAEYQTRPATAHKAPEAYSRDRLPRLYSLVLALSAVVTTEAVHGVTWSANLLAVGLICSATAGGELLYRRYGPKPRSSR